MIEYAVRYTGKPAMAEEFEEEDGNKIIDYTKYLKKQVVVLNTDNKNKDIEINKLLKENGTFRNNKELVKRNEIIKEQKSTIKEQKQEINRLNGVVKILENSIEDWKKKVKEVKMKVRIDIMNKTKYKNNKHYCYISLKSHFK